MYDCNYFLKWSSSSTDLLSNINFENVHAFCIVVFHECIKRNLNWYQGLNCNIAPFQNYVFVQYTFKKWLIVILYHVSYIWQFDIN